MIPLQAKKGKLLGDALLAVLIALVFCFNLLSYFGYKLEDRVFQQPTSINPDLVVVGIDEEALAMFGRADQWSRQFMANAVEILNSGEAKPAVIAIDVIYAGETDPVADAALALAAAEGGNVVLASNALIGKVPSPENAFRLIDAVVDYETPYPALAQNAACGFVNPIIEKDSIIRNAMLKYPFGDDYIYSFPYEICKEYLGESDAARLPDQYETYLTYADLPGAYKQLSFADIFAEDFEPEYFDGCIVLIGPYAPGLMDAYFTPISRDELMYGVEIHANVVQMLLEGDLKHYAAPTVNFALLLLLVLLAMLLARFVDLRFLLVIFALLVGGYYAAALYIFGRGYILSLIYPVFALAIIYIYQLVYGYILETLEKRKVKDAFKKYVDAKLVDSLMDSGEANSNEVGVAKDIAVLFVDVRGFTPMSEALQDHPEQVVKILNEYLELTSISVFNNGGSVDKFIGDATMALFNGFYPVEDYVFKAVKAAWDMVQGAAEVNASIKEKYQVDVGFGVGVNCGKAIVGNLGPSFRKDYTAIGDTVNTAARLESNAKRSEVLISKAVYDLVKDRVTVEPMGEMPLKGKSIKLEIYSLKGVSG